MLRPLFWSWRTIISVGLPACFAFACSNPQSEDLDNFCKVVNEVNRDSSLPTAEAKLAKIGERIAEYSKGGADAWKKLSASPTDKKYGLLLDSAKSIGKGDYKCSGYERLLATVAVEENAKKLAEQPKPDAGVAPEPPKPAKAPEDDKRAAATAKKDKKAHGKKSKKKRR
jgi:hypothetical protein